MVDRAVIIPARLASQRFPNKLLFPILGKPLILWTAENVAEAVPDWPLFFAVEDEALARVLRKSGYEVLLTRSHASGTDRLAEANQIVGAEVVVNIQADEPLTGTAHIEQLFSLMAPGVSMATLGEPLIDADDFINPNRVKVVCGLDGRALYFSRAPIPFWRDGGAGALSPSSALHIGMYAYTAAFLSCFGSLRPGVLECLEKLEQLRALEHGHRIQVGMSSQPGMGVDTPEDVPRLEKCLRDLGY